MERYVDFKGYLESIPESYARYLGLHKGEGGLGIVLHDFIDKKLEEFKRGEGVGEVEGGRGGGGGGGRNAKL